MYDDLREPSFWIAVAIWGTIWLAVLILGERFACWIRGGTFQWNGSPSLNLGRPMGPPSAQAFSLGDSSPLSIRGVSNAPSSLDTPGSVSLSTGGEK